MGASNLRDLGKCSGKKDEDEQQKSRRDIMHVSYSILKAQATVRERVCDGKK